MSADGALAEESPQALMDASDPANPEHAAGEARASDRHATGSSAAGADRDGGVHVTLVDFTQPSKFTLELRRRIATVMAPFTKALALRLSGELKREVLVRQLPPRELSWSAARSEMARGRVQAVMVVQEHGGRLLITAELPLALRAVECLLGGRPEDAPEERELGDVDRALTERLLRLIGEQLAVSWRELGGIELAVQEIIPAPGGKPDIELPQAEATFVMDLECRIGPTTAKLQLMLPWSSAAPMAAESEADGAQLDAEAMARRSALNRSLAATKVLLRAEVGTTRMSVDEVLALGDGGIVRLNAKAEKGVRLFASHIALACGMPGRSGAFKAVQLTTAAEPRLLPVAEPVAALPGSMREYRGLSLREQLHHLSGVDVIVSAELGRAQLPLKTALRLPQGAVLELEEPAESPVTLFANGLRFASGSLAVSPDGDWCVNVGPAEQLAAEPVAAEPVAAEPVAAEPVAAER